MRTVRSAVDRATRRSRSPQLPEALGRLRRPEAAWISRGEHDTAQRDDLVVRATRDRCSGDGQRHCASLRPDLVVVVKCSHRHAGLWRPAHRPSTSAPRCPVRERSSRVRCKGNL